MTIAGNSQHHVVIGRLSAPRMARYLTSAQGDPEKALLLYAEQARVAAALWQTIGHVEVIMRNAMHDAISLHSTDWYVGLGHVFNAQTLQDVADARKRVAKRVPIETPGHVVSELNFGFWRFLLSKQYDRFLWTPYLHAAFPHYRGRRDQLFDLTVRVNDARNYVAHHQRVEKPKAARNDALLLASYVCPTSRDWIKGQCMVLTELADN